MLFFSAKPAAGLDRRYVAREMEKRFNIRRFTPALVTTVWNDVQKDDCLDLAAQMSFYFVLSLFPFLIVIGSIVGWLPSTDLWRGMVQWLTDYLPLRPRLMVFDAILDLTQHNTQFFSFGLVTTIWVASSGFVSLMESLSLAHGFPETRNFWKKRIIAIFATLIGAVFTIATFGLLTFGHFLEVAINPQWHRMLPFPFPSQLARWLVTLLMMFLGLALINYFLPNANQPWRWLTPGIVFVALGLAMMSLGFNFYLQHFGSYPRFYGAMTTFVILATWIYMASLILLIGAEIDSAVERRSRQGAFA